MTTRSIHEAQLIRSESPFNAEPRLEVLARDFVTPVELFYVRNHGTVPVIDPLSHFVDVEGAVKQRLRLSVEDVRGNFSRVTVTATLQCAGNRRSEMSVLRPIDGEVPWGAQAIGNAVWSGAPLAEILQAAGLADGARHVEFIGVDDIEKDGKHFGFGASVSIAKALDPHTIVAYEMNGRPLDAMHGAPLRGIVPGFIGARSVKWLRKITVQDEPSRNYYRAHSYKLFPSDATAATADWERGIAIEETALNSVICQPHDGARLAGRSVRVQGYAIGGGGSPISRVEISIDGSSKWMRASLADAPEAWSWCRWEAHVPLGRGSHRLAVRATDAAGGAQPDDGSGQWNFKGYAYNAWHAVSVDVD